MGGPRTTQIIQQNYEQRSPSDTPQARLQPQDPEQENWGDEMDIPGEDLTDDEVAKILRGD